MSSRDRFEAHMAARTGCDSCSAMNTEAHWLTWQARDAEVARLVEALRETLPAVDRDLAKRIAELLREYKETQDGQ